MKRLWAPWRKAYIRPKTLKKNKGCLFCRLIKQNQDKKNLIFKRGVSSYGVLNLFPYNNGHALIIPNRHIQSLDQLRPEEQLDFLDLTSLTIHVLERSMKAKGFNVGLNLGSAANKLDNATFRQDKSPSFSDVGAGTKAGVGVGAGVGSGIEVRAGVTLVALKSAPKDRP